MCDIIRNENWYRYRGSNICDKDIFFYDRLTLLIGSLIFNVNYSMETMNEQVNGHFNDYVCLWLKLIGLLFQFVLSTCAYYVENKSDLSDIVAVDDRLNNRQL